MRPPRSRRAFLLSLRRALALAEGREHVGTLRDGSPVFSRIDEDHLAAHPEAGALLPVALAAIEVPPPRGEYASFVHEFDRVVGLLTCVPTDLGDDILFARRVGRREGLTRFVRGREGVPCRSFVVWLRTTEEGVVVLTTAYAGRITPQEPWNPRTRVSVATWEASVAFWSKHALLWDGLVEGRPPPGPEARAYWGERPVAASTSPPARS